MCLFIVQAGENSARIVDVTVLGDVTALGLVGGAPGGETPRVADSSAAGAGRFFHNSVPPSKQNRLGNPPRTMCNVRVLGELAYRHTSSRNPRRQERIAHCAAGAKRGGAKPSLLRRAASYERFGASKLRKQKTRPQSSALFPPLEQRIKPWRRHPSPSSST
jgi:hypothetical protein